jgi:NAD(P)-dependent dehydrogenase (short-subunit alcohol dehydrogenase family)
VARSIENLVAVVSGGASGLGRATAERLIAGGAVVGLIDVNVSAVEETAAALGPRAIAVPADVTSSDELHRSLVEVEDAAGEIRLAVACHGVLHGARTVDRNGPADLAGFARTVEINLVGTFNLVRLAAAAMADNTPDEDGERGVLVLTASIAAFEGQVGQTAYAASKAGIVGLTLPLARDLAPMGIRVATIAPGTFDTPMMASLPESARESIAQGIPFPSRLGRPPEFARMVCDIAENPAVNGCTYRLDGALRLAAR